MKDPKTTQPTTEPTTQKEAVLEKLRDLSLEDLDIVVGGSARCDNNISQPLD